MLALADCRLPLWLLLAISLLGPARSICSELVGACPAHLDLVGYANFSFIASDEFSQDDEDALPADTRMTAVLPLVALPLFSPGDRFPQQALAGGIRGTGELQSGVKTLLRQISNIWRRLSAQMGLDEFYDLSRLRDHIDMATDEIADRDLTAEEREAVDRLIFALTPLMDELKASVIQPAMNCSLQHLHCPKWSWRAQIQAGAQGNVRSEAAELMSELKEFDEAFGVESDSWMSFWLLLSKEPGAALLGLFDPDQVRHTEANLWPPRDALGQKSGSAAELQAHTLPAMQRGDLIWWRPAQVPSGISQGVLGPDRRVLHEFSTEYQTRSSFDFRCVCTRQPHTLDLEEEQTTATGEVCRRVWRDPDGNVHVGCANPDDDPRGPWCVIQREHRGGRGCLKQETENGEVCTQFRYDHCQSPIEEVRSDDDERLADQAPAPFASAEEDGEEEVAIGSTEESEEPDTSPPLTTPGRPSTDLLDDIAVQRASTIVLADLAKRAGEELARRFQSDS